MIDFDGNSTTKGWSFLPTPVSNICHDCHTSPFSVRGNKEIYGSLQSLVSRGARNKIIIKSPLFVYKIGAVKTSPDCYHIDLYRLCLLYYLAGFPNKSVTSSGFRLTTKSAPTQSSESLTDNLQSYFSTSFLQLPWFLTILDIWKCEFLTALFHQEYALHAPFYWGLLLSSRASTHYLTFCILSTILKIILHF